ncbi:MAG: hypothetical protein JNM79_25595 [Burkholderiales bacterium]|nr:hypothetical protein [Burkholderiales bacterium]
MQLATALVRDRRSPSATDLDDPHDQSATPAVPHAGRVAFLVVATIAIGLAVDRVAGFPGQVVVSIAVWAILTGLVLRLPRPLATRLVACTWISGLGEMVASLAWGLYDYQFGNVPLFVPPGHALLYLLGLILAQRLPARAALAVPLMAAPLVAWLAFCGLDTLSLPLFAIFCVFMAFGRHKRLYATMFVIALLLELYGTALGNWSWRPVAPGLGLATLNPPLAAGVFYCALDWLVHRRVFGLRGSRARASC